MTDSPARRTTQPAERGVPVNLRDDGLLWLINATVFHPRGFSLGWSPSTGEFMLFGDGSEAWGFDPADEPTPDTLKAAAERLFAGAAEAHRVAAARAARAAASEN